MLRSIGLGMAGVTIIVTAFLIFDRFNQIAAVRTGFWGNMAYRTSQSDFELMRLIDALQQGHDPDAQIDPFELEIRFEVALSRFVSLTEGRTARRILANEFAREIIEESISLLEELEPKILQFNDVDRSEQHQVIQRLRLLSQQFHRATVSIASLGDTEQAAFYQRLMRSARVEIVLLFLVFCAGALAFINAFVERRRYVDLNRSLAENVAARTSELELTNASLRVEILERSKAEERYHALVDLATDAIMIFDVEAEKCIEANPSAARLFGYAVEDLLKIWVPTEMSPEFQADGRRSEVAARGYLEDALQGEFPTFDWVHKTPEGESFLCEVSLARFPDPDRKLVRASVIDVTERKASEQLQLDLQSQLTQAQKLEAIGQMTDGVAHDFNNLLNVILGNMALLREQTDDEENQELINAAIAATYRGADLTKNMLSFARRAYLQPTKLDLSGIVQNLENWIGRTIPANIRVEKSLLPNLWPVEADISSTESAILNLMINARDSMPNGGVITLETENVVLDGNMIMERGENLKPGRYTLLAVSDTGNGIPEEQLDKVFDPFFTTKGPAEGSGLGLSMVHGFMRQSGGGARVYSEVGLGTTLKLYFPVFQMHSQVDESPDLPADKVKAVAGRILIAEDQKPVVDLLVRFLRNEGHEVVPAYTGDEAFEIFQSDGSFDLLVTDIVMPGRLQGTDLAREIRKMNSAMPVVFMSGYAREATIHGNGLRDSDIRLMKPVSKKTLIDAVHAALTSGPPSGL